MALTKDIFYEIFKDGMAENEVRAIIEKHGAELVATWDNCYGFRGSEEEEAEFYEFAQSAESGEAVHLAGDEIGHFMIIPFFDENGNLRYLKFEWIAGFGYGWEEYQIYRFPSAEPVFLLRKDDVFHYLTIWLPTGNVARLKEDYDPKIMDYIVQVFIDDELKMILTEGAEKPWFFSKEQLEAAIRERGARQTLRDILEYLINPVMNLMRKVSE
jgi:hypothetical protein